MKITFLLAFMGLSAVGSAPVGTALEFPALGTRWTFCFSEKTRAEVRRNLDTALQQPDNQYHVFARDFGKLTVLDTEKVREVFRRPALTEIHLLETAVRVTEIVEFQAGDWFRCVILDPGAIAIDAAA